MCFPFLHSTVSGPLITFISINTTEWSTQCTYLSIDNQIILYNNILLLVAQVGLIALGFMVVGLIHITVLPTCWRLNFFSSKIDIKICIFVLFGGHMDWKYHSESRIFTILGDFQEILGIIREILGIIREEGGNCLNIRETPEWFGRVGNTDINNFDALDPDNLAEHVGEGRHERRLASNPMLYVVASSAFALIGTPDPGTPSLHSCRPWETPDTGIMSTLTEEQVSLVQDTWRTAKAKTSMEDLGRDIFLR